MLYFYTADYLKICHKSDPKLNDCVKESIETLKPKIANGISDLLIPPCHPLEIPIVKMKQNAGSVSLESEYTNILVYGLTNFTLRSVRYVSFIVIINIECMFLL